MIRPAELTVTLRRPHDQQRAFIDSPARRKVIRAGRRGGKTVGLATLAVMAFLAGRRVLYATPTAEQIDAFWYEVKAALREPVDAGVLYKNETQHIIERPGTRNRIRAKTAWNADTLRGDTADLLILDEWQLMNEEAWDKVGAPMLLDNDGDAVFSYTPPSPRTRSASKATNPLHAAQLFKRAAADPDKERWQTFTFTSFDNPHISREALGEISRDMTALSYKMEILAEDIDDVPGALWTRDTLDTTRVNRAPDLYRIVVGVDPAASTGQTGIVVVGAARMADGQAEGYVLLDATTPEGASPSTWASAVVAAYHRSSADRVVGETNNGGDMIETVIRSVPDGRNISYSQVRATRGKYVRAEPVAALFEQGRGHMVGYYAELEDELCSWVQGENSPNRLDALVWAFTELGLVDRPEPASLPISQPTKQSAWRY